MTEQRGQLTFPRGSLGPSTVFKAIAGIYVLFKAPTTL